MAGRARIAQVIASAETGGAQRCALELAARLDPGRFASELVVAGPVAEGPLVESARARGVRVRHVRFRSLRSPLGDARLARALLPEHLVHVHSRPLDHQVGLLLGSAGRVLGGPRFVWTRHLPYGDLGPAALRRVRWAAKAASAVVACSPCVGRHLLETERLPETRVHQIANGVDTARFRPPSPLERRILRRAHCAGEDPVMIAVGRLCAQKGFERLLETAARLRQPGLPGWQLWIVGDGPDRAALTGLAGRLGLGSRVRWFGDRADVDRLLRAADLFVLLSHREGLPLAVLEALASGLPAVVTDLPAGAMRLKQTAAGIRNTVVNGEVVLTDNEYSGATPGVLLRS